MSKNASYYIDSHVHITRDLTKLFAMPEEWVLTAMERYHIDFCLVSNGDGAECGHNQEVFPPEHQQDQVITLKKDIEFAKAHDGKIGILPWISPLLQGYSKEFEEVVRTNREYIYGMKLHPYHNKTAPDAKCIRPYLELAAELKLPVVSHTGGCEEASIEHLYQAAKQFPEIPFIMAHMGLGSDNKEAIEYLGKLDNLYGDTTWVPVTTTLEVIRRYGSHRILFGSDMPIDGADTYHHNPKGERSIYQEYFNEFHDMVSQEDYDNVMYKNACRLFHIHL